MFRSAAVETFSSTFTFQSTGNPLKRDGIKKDVCFKGFAHGMIIVEKDEVENSKSTIEFYDPGSATNAAITKTTVNIVEWREKPGFWPGGL